MPPTPSFASLHYGLPYSIWQAIIRTTYNDINKPHRTSHVKRKNIYTNYNENVAGKRHRDERKFIGITLDSGYTFIQ